MSDQLKEFDKEMKSFEATLNRALAENPQLSSFKLGFLMLSPKENNPAQKLYEAKAIQLKARWCEKGNHPYYGGYPCRVHGV